MQYDQVTINNLTKKFSDKRDTYNKFAKAIEAVIKKRLLDLKINEFSTKSRAKDIESFKGKIERKSYVNPLIDITDLAGIRIILCYTDQLKIVEEIIYSEFIVDPDKSVDKSQLYDPATFGYLSNHYIVSNNKKKQADSKWKDFNNLFAEIQVRSSLQDSWAMVSHALYKNEKAVPTALFRRLNRIAGLFELADQEFVEIKTIIEKYVAEIQQNFDSGNTETIGINYHSIMEFISRSHEVIEAKNVAKNSGLLADQNLQQEYYNKIDCQIIVEICNLLNISNLEELDKLLKENRRNNALFIKNISSGRIWKFTHSFILFLLILKAKNGLFPSDFLTKNYGWSSQTANAVIYEAKKCNSQA